MKVMNMVPTFWIVYEDKYVHKCFKTQLEPWFLVGVCLEVSFINMVCYREWCSVFFTYGASENFKR